MERAKELQQARNGDENHRIKIEKTKKAEELPVWMPKQVRRKETTVRVRSRKRRLLACMIFI